MDKTKNLYLMVSKTPTRFGYMIRKVGRIRYNHSAIALDENLQALYSFARLQHNSLFDFRRGDDNKCSTCYNEKSGFRNH